jgi:hypothetical protein
MVMSEHKSAEQLFNKVPDVNLSGPANLYCAVTESRLYVEIADHEDEPGIMLTIEEARALRDWLNRSVP